MANMLNSYLRRESPHELLCVSAYSPSDRIFYMSDGCLWAVLDLTPCP